MDSDDNSGSRRRDYNGYIGVLLWIKSLMLDRTPNPYRHNFLEGPYRKCARVILRKA